MKVRSVSVKHVPAGWRTWTFVKIETDNLVGYSEVTDSHGSPAALEAAILEMAPLILGKEALDSEAIYWLLYSRTRQSVGSTITKAISGITNALLDIKGKHFGVPVHQLFGGKLRDSIPLYWSHCGTTRVRAAEHCGIAPISDLDDLSQFAQGIGTFGAIKTNIAVFGDEPYIYMPGFHKGLSLDPALNYEKVIRDVHDWVGTFHRNYVGEIILDMNYNFKTEGYITIGRSLEKYNLLWLELDSYDAKAVRYIRDKVNIPICSGENLYGLHQYKPFFDNYSMDICSIDILWNGFERSLDIAKVANLHEMNVTPHNYYSHLASFMAANWCACVPNLRYMEYDVDDVPHRNSIVTRTPYIAQGNMLVPDEPGWGVDLKW